MKNGRQIVRLLLGLIVLSTFRFHFSTIQAQNQILHDQYNDVSFYNPAISNVDGDFHHAVQVWSHVAFAPKDFKLHYETEPYEDVDVGARYQGRMNHHIFSASYHYDGYSFFHQHTLNFSYGYEFVIKDIHRLAIGGRLQVNFCDIMPNKLSVQTEWLKSFQMTPDIDLGIEYRLRGLHVGVSVMNIAGSSANNNTSLIVYERRGYLNLSYDFLLDKGKHVMLSPHMLFYYGQHSLSAEMGIDLNLWKYVHVGYTFRIQEMRHIATIGMEYKGFTFDFASNSAPRTYKQRLQMMVGYKF